MGAEKDWYGVLERETLSGVVAAQPEVLVAVDLGSNSFRMVIARILGDELLLVDRLREGVRLAASLDADSNLSPEGQERALHCLEKFGQRLRDIPHPSVRAVGTNTLRKARNVAEFLARARQALGHEIEVISGQEEARLIYLGASHSLSSGARQRLVVDIGGGSTECICGRGFEPELTASLYMGCVSYTQEFFPGGMIKRRAMQQAEIAAQLELQSIEKAFRRQGWDECAGASGTVIAIEEILRKNGWSEQGITPRGLRKLRKAVLDFDHIDQLEGIPGLRGDRARVLPGGLAILSAVFTSLGIHRMGVSSGALREGVLYDLLGRIRHEDVRDRTIKRFVERFHVDVDQARRVGKTARLLLEQVAGAWNLDVEAVRPFLTWGARLHEVGLVVAHSGFHKHGAYLIAHADMPGFSFQDQRLLSLLVRGHRRRLPVAVLRELPPEAAQLTLRLSVLLRLAVLLNRSRSRRPLPECRLRALGTSLRLTFPPGWLGAHPLTRADLENEVEWLRTAGFELRFGKHAKSR